MSNQLRGLEYLVADATADDVFTPEDLSPDDRQIAATAEKFTAEQLVPQQHAMEHHDWEVTTRLLRAAGELGLLMIDVPELDGGLGLGKATSSVVSERIGPATSFTVTSGAHTGIGTLPLVYYGTPPQKERYLAKVISGEWPSAYCLTEPGSGSDALGARTTARLTEDGKHYVLQGTKQFITNGAFAKLFTVFAKIDGKHFTAFLVERGTPGLTIGPEEKKLGIKGSSTTQVILDDAKVPVENVLGEIGKGHKIAFNVLNVGRFKLGAQAVGCAKAALRDALRYAVERKQFGVPIATFGAIAEKAADMVADVFASESMQYRVAGLLDERIGAIPKDAPAYYERYQQAIDEYVAECAVVKVYCSEALAFVADEALQVFGGYGYTQEYSAERYYRDERINRIFEGTNEINRIIVPVTLLRRVAKGELQLERRPGVPVSSPRAGAPEPATEERALLARCKVLFASEATAAARRFGDRIRDEQEVLLAVADLAIQVLALESAVLRAERDGARLGAAARGRLEDAARVAAFRAAEEMGRAARRVVSYTAEAADRGARLEAAQRATAFGAGGVLEAKRRLAKAAFEAGRYPL